MALSVKSALSGSPRPLAGTLSCGDRTFLSQKRSDYPSGKPRTIISRFTLYNPRFLIFFCAFEHFGSILVISCLEAGHRAKPLFLKTYLEL